MTSLRRNAKRTGTQDAERQVKIHASFSAANDATLYYGDCRRMLARIPDEAVSLVVTSPPYNIGKAYERKRPLNEYLQFHASVITELVRVLKPGGSICWQVGNYVNGDQVYPLDILMHPLFAQYETSHSLRLRNRIVWHFEHGLNAQSRFSGRHEAILWYTKGDKYAFNLDEVRVPQKYPGKKHFRGTKKGEFSGNPLGKNPGDVWIFPNVKSNHVEKTEHPCQFPLELPGRFIRALTEKGDLVLDPFVGVGTTVAAALLLGRKGAGADTCKEYIEIARDRAKKAWKRTLLFREERAVFEPPADTPLTTRPAHFAAPRPMLDTALHAPRSASSQD